MASDRVRGNSKGRIVLLDTSALFMIFEQSIRLHDELDRLLGLYKINILQSISDELQSLYHTGTDKQKRYARMAFSFIKSYQIIDDKPQETVDETLIHMAKILKAVVVTNDKAVRKKPHRLGITTICLRGKNHLMIC